MGIWIFLIIVGGLFFIYFNLRIVCKANLTYSYLRLYINLSILKKIYTLDKKFYYLDFISKSTKRYEDIKTKKYFPYLKKLAKVRRLFIIKNILLYPECFDNLSSFAIEFTIVNNVIKRPLIMITHRSLKCHTER